MNVAFALLVLIVIFSAWRALTLLIGSRQQPRRVRSPPHRLL